MSLIAKWKTHNHDNCFFVHSTAPSGVTPPTDPVSITGYIIRVSWQRPSGNTGLLTHYILTAYDQDRDGEMVEARFEDTSPAEYTGKKVIYYTRNAC